MNYTELAHKILMNIDDRQRRIEVARRARHLALAAGRAQVTKADMEAALLVASDEFLPKLEMRHD